MPASLTVVRILAGWYDENRRSLPWRDDPEPYRVWISEIILQQTRVEQGLPYFLRFIKQFPDIRALARAPEEKVLRLWQGLGYYSRARNLHACAKAVVENFSGKFPQRAEELLQLPGIGPYTAAAIASICFQQAVPVIDGNVYRVLSRVFGITESISSPSGKKIFAQAAEKLMRTVPVLPNVTPGNHNQALMEFGALHCTPRSPNCGECPLASECVARKKGMQEMLPVKDKIKIRRIRHFHYLVLTDNTSIVVRLRGPGDIWHGLYDFPAVESSVPLTARKIAAGFRSIAGISSPPDQSVYVRHLLTHQEIHGHFHLFRVDKIKLPSAVKTEPVLRKFPKKDLHKLPKPIMVVRTLEKFGLLKKRADSTRKTTG